MAPILKEADAPVTTATTTVSPAAPAAKSTAETPARPQPVPLEIPVTVNGARTVEGSDKREPFAEATQTVLVFPHGAVIRIATQLAPGQLVFLTNEKTKKEVVCQVVKSKSGGSANGYVELQFTEPAPAFWGLRLPGTVAPPPASAPAVPRSVVPAPAPKVVAPAAPIAKVPVPSTVAPPVAQIPAPPKPAVAPPPPSPPVIQPAPSAPPQSAAPVAPSSPLFIAPPPPAPKLPESAPVAAVTPVETNASAPLVSTPPPSPLSAAPISLPAHTPPKPLIPPPSTGPHDFSKEIESLFAVPQAPEVATPKPAAPAVPVQLPISSSPSTEELKLQAARLQEQLSAMLFTEGPAKETKTPAPAEIKLDTPVAEVANKLLEIAHQEPTPILESTAKAEVAAEPKLEIKPETKPATASRTPVFSSLNAKDEEVAIPAWLRPLSQNSEVIAETPAPTGSTETVASNPNAGALEDSAAADSSARSEAAVFGGQLLSGDSAAESAAASSSKKGLVFGLVAVIVLAAAGGAWYYSQNHTATPVKPAGQISNVPAPSEPAGANLAPSSTTTTPSRPAAISPAPSNTTNSNPARTSAAVPSTSSPAEPRRNAEARNPAPIEEPAAKPSLGEVHLAAPVVRGSGEGHASGDSLPSIDTPAATSGADAFDALGHHKAPAVPLPVGGDVKTAQLLKSVPPVYPQMAKTQRITGNVTLDALIDADGNVAQVKVISGPPMLHQAAVDAVKQWKYSPAQLNGNPTAMHLTVTVQFRTQ